MAAVYGVQWRWNRLRRTRSEDERGQVDRHPCRPDLRFALATACPRGSLCVHGLEGEVCERFRGGVDQGDGPRSLRRRLTSAKKRAVNPVSVVWIGRSQPASPGVSFPGLVCFGSVNSLATVDGGASRYFTERCAHDN